MSNNQNKKIVKYKLLPSTLLFKPERINDIIAKVRQHPQINMMHFDVMDGIYVSTKTNEIDILNALINDGYRAHIHLMVIDPVNWVNQFLMLKNIKGISFPFEVNDFDTNMYLFRKIQSYGIKAGIQIHPNMKFNDYVHYLPYVNYVTLMSVIPGKGGQNFLSDSVQKLQQLNQYKEQHDLKFKIEIDGGINESYINLLKDSVRYFVVGSTIMKYLDDLNMFFLKLL
ncbi:beta/alpha barrel domain-containing protein [Ureaplasma canigenitalium]|uniref:hypothetical protein n=1 Tax=Ureaplasma canigenitalium TaxID=42092 RepID=UPI00068973E1|nr:hypothetical protein [Ureaplasma canigenitalium]